MRPTRLLSTLAACAIAACGGAPTTSTETPVAVPVAGSFEMPAESRQPEVEIELLDAGSGEQRALRFTSQVGDEIHVHLQMAMELELSVGGQGSGATATPPVETRYVQRTTAVDPDGRIRAEFEMQGIDVAQDGSPMAQQMANTMAPLGDATGWFILDSRGRTLATEFIIPNADATVRDSLDNIRNTMTQVAPPFPEEPVGVGARWTARSVLNGKITIQQVATYTVVELLPDGVVLDTQVSQTAAPQPVETGQEGVQAELVTMEGNGTGRMNVNTTRTIPTRSEVSLESRSEMMVSEAGQQQAIRLGLRMNMVVTGE